MHSDQTQREKELRANERLCKEKHPNIVEVFKSGQFRGSSHIFIDMELCGMNLETFIQKNREISEIFPPGVRELLVWDIMKQIANGLVFIHGKGHVHRDINPRNGTSVNHI